MMPLPPRSCRSRSHASEAPRWFWESQEYSDLPEAGRKEKIIYQVSEITFWEKQIHISIFKDANGGAGLPTVASNSQEKQNGTIDSYEHIQQSPWDPVTSKNIIPTENTWVQALLALPKQMTPTCHGSGKPLIIFEAMMFHFRAQRWSNKGTSHPLT